MSGKLDLACLNSFTQALDAHSLAQLLESNGIKAIIDGESVNNALATNWFGYSALFPVRVLVRAGDLDQAKQIMSRLPAKLEASIAAWNCECGEPVDEGFVVCWSCGADWPGLPKS